MKKALLLLCFSIALLNMQASGQNPVEPGWKQIDAAAIEECKGLEHGLMMRCLQQKMWGAPEKNVPEAAAPDFEQAEVNGDDEEPGESVPEKNPVLVDVQSVQLGLTVYTQNCLPCHGPSGKGDGPTAQYFGGYVADLSDAGFQSLEDGEIFLRINNGSWPMPSFGYGSHLSQEEIWSVINYIRALAGK